LSSAINVAKKDNNDKKLKNALKKAKELPRQLAALEKKELALREKVRIILLQLPNILHDTVPIGEDEQKNIEIKKFGSQKKFLFPVKSHVEIGEALGMLDFDTSADTSGKGFYFMKGDLALLNMALVNFARDFMVKQGYEYVEPPLMIRREILDGVYTHAEIEELAYKVEGEDLYLIATSEHPLIGQFIGKTIEHSQLPLMQTGYSMCFRKEIGSHGIDEKGIFRTHQFNKQEMIVICEPEDSHRLWQQILDHSVAVFRQLEIPFRILEICSGDLGDLKHKQVDLEAWSPRKKDYFEITSCSNLTDAQARRLSIKIHKQGKKYFAHTLNNTVIATSRALVAILENNQQKDGSVKIPNVLVPYMGGKTHLR
jgi:seryl-tRNA synthetase